MAKKWLLLFVAVTEDDLPDGVTYTALPDRLDGAISTVAPEVVDLQAVYLLDKKQKQFIERIADDTAIDYHHHAVNVRGEKCKEENCEQHPTQNVLDFHDHSRRHRTPPGVN